jgi:hypothetical protein
MDGYRFANILKSETKFTEQATGKIMKIATSITTCIDGESLNEWLNFLIKEELGVDSAYLLPLTPIDLTSESSTFAAIDIDTSIDKDTLLSRRVKTNDKKNAYFYIQDVVEAAVGLGLLKESYYHVYYKNSH